LKLILTKYIYQIVGLLKHQYKEKYSNSTWRSCREAINQAARDSRRKEPNDF